MWHWRDGTSRPDDPRPRHYSNISSGTSRDFSARQFKETSGRRDDERDEGMLGEKKRRRAVVVSRPFEQSGQSLRILDAADLATDEEDFREGGGRQ